MDKLEALTLRSPSLIDATSLTVKGPCKFVPGIKIVGDVTFVNGADLAMDAPGAGTLGFTERSCVPGAGAMRNGPVMPGEAGSLTLAENQPCLDACFIQAGCGNV